MKKVGIPKPKSSKANKDSSVIIGVSRLARMFDESHDWARKLLRDWFEEDQRVGGPVRVFKRKGRGPHAAKGALYTTLPVIQREMPPTRDVFVTKKLAEHERDLDTLANRVNALTSELAYLRKKLGG